jgi:hypothetical protein
MCQRVVVVFWSMPVAGCVLGGVACCAVGGCLQSGAALVDVRLDVLPLLTLSSLPTVAGCLLGGYLAGRGWWGGDRIVGGVLPRISIGVHPMCKVDEHQCS